MTRGILFTETHGRNFYLVKVPERFYFADVFVCCVLFLASSFGNCNLCNCLGFQPQDACQQAQKWIRGSLSFFFVVELCLLPFRRTSCVVSPSLCLLRFRCASFCSAPCILQVTVRFLRNSAERIKLKIRCIWISVPESHGAVLTVPSQRAPHPLSLPVTLRLFRALCLQGLRHQSLKCSLGALGSNVPPFLDAYKQITSGWVKA